MSMGHPLCGILSSLWPGMGGSPKVSTSYIDPKGSTFSPENPSKWSFTGSGFSLPMPILSNADAKMMSTELL